MRRSASTESETVPDSEPEREAQRQQKRLEKGSRGTAPHRERGLAMNITTPKPFKDSVSVIELSDDDDMNLEQPLPQKADNVPQADIVTIVDISDDSPSPPAHTVQDPVFGHLSMFDSSVEYDASVRPLDVAKFSFQPKTVPARPIPNSSRSVHTSARAPVSEAPSTQMSASRKPAKPASHRFADEFSDSQLATITTCISCEVKWTVRKSVVQKMLHIQSCSKKRSLTDDNVREKIRQALQLHSAVAAPSALSIPKDTILAGVVQDAAPKRVRKRVAVIPTVQAPTETRDEIRAKAAAVIRQQDLPSRNKGKAREMDEENTEFPPLPTTQPFAPSKLGVATKGKDIIYGSSDESMVGEKDEDFPASQPFQASNLGQQATNPHSRTLNAVQWISSSSSSSARSQSLVSPMMKKRKKKKAKSPPSCNASDSDIAEPLLLLSGFPEPWGEEDSGAHLHYIPSPAVKSPSSGLSTSPIQNITKGAESPTKAKEKTPIQRSPRKVKEPVTKKMPELFNEAWEQEMKRRILADTTLHLRILRLEPVSIDTFIKAVQDPGAAKPSGKFMTSFKAFLDKQAIHFYGGT